MRVTNDIKEAILTQETRNKFHDKTLKLEKELGDLVTLEAKKHISSLPLKFPQNLIDADYIKTTNRVKFKNIKGKNYMTEFTAYERFPYSDYQDYITIEKASAKLVKLNEKVIQNEKDEREFENNLRNLLRVYTSSKPLLTQIPELAIYFKDDAKKATALVPLELIKNVRKQLKRPMAEEKIR